jgi:hypothetical protein
LEDFKKEQKNCIAHYWIIPHAGLENAIGFWQFNVLLQTASGTTIMGEL